MKYLNRRKVLVGITILTIITIVFLNLMSIENILHLKAVTLEKKDLIINSIIQETISMTVVRMLIAFIILSGLAWVLHYEISKRAATEQNLRMVNINLEFLVQQRTADIEKALTEVDQSNKQLETQSARLKCLREIDLAIMGSYDLYLPMKTLISEGSPILKFDAACIHLFDPNTQTFNYIAGQGFRTSGSYIPANKNKRLMSKAIHEMRIQQAVYTLEDSPIEGEDFVASVAIPLISKGVASGVIVFFYRQPHNLSMDQLDLITTLAGQASIAITNHQLFQNLHSKNLELLQAYDATIEGWSAVLEMRDFETEGHSIRVAEFTLAMAQSAGMSGKKLIDVRRGALLHDIGKLALPDSILNKPAPLTEEERKIMEKHPVLAFTILSPIDFLQPALIIPYCHHEKWDGTGYPRGLKGKKIPLAARLFAVVDVWDALRSDRPYRKAWSEEEALQHIRKSSGTHFDPQAVEIFFSTLEKELDQA